MTPALTEGGIQVSSQTASIQAAIEGRGVALGHGLAVRGDIAAGKLIRLFPKVLCPSEASCYIVYRPEYANLQPLVTFVSWLKNEVLAWQQTA
ncbi:LysR substrate-binding domain-containing protein [Dyella jiangningensis]|nr:LysR substrate-binding domain-containing protein [Dyella jiangningensis]MDG2539203.1 LysR substrate-binding domain-containing protein [Dyella jiangningensis]